MLYLWTDTGGVRGPLSLMHGGFLIRSVDLGAVQSRSIALFLFFFLLLNVQRRFFIFLVLIFYRYHPRAPIFAFRVPDRACAFFIGPTLIAAWSFSCGLLAWLWSVLCLFLGDPSKFRRFNHGLVRPSCSFTHTYLFLFVLMKKTLSYAFWRYTTLARVVSSVVCFCSAWPNGL